MSTPTNLLRVARYVTTCLRETYDMNPKHLAILYRLYELVCELPCGPNFAADLRNLMTGDSLKNTILPSVATTNVCIATFIHNLDRVFPAPLFRMSSKWGQHRVVLGPHELGQAMAKKRSLLALHIATTVGRFFPGALDILEYSAINLDKALRTQCSVEELLTAIEVLHTLSMNVLWDNTSNIHALHHRLACAVMHASFPELECPKTSTAKVIHNDLITRYSTDQVTHMRETLSERIAPRPHTSPDGRFVEPFLCSEAETLPFFAAGWFLASEQSSGTIKAVRIPEGDKESIIVVEHESESRQVASLQETLELFGDSSVVTFYCMQTCSPK